MVLGLIAGFVGLMILINPFSGNTHLNFIGIISLTLTQYFGQLVLYILIESTIQIVYLHLQVCY